MGLFDNIKLSLAESNLKKLSGGLSRKKGNLDFGTSRTIALLFNASNKEESDLIAEYINT